MKETQRTITLACALSLLAALGVLAQDYAISWYTIDGGGTGPANPSSGGSYTLSGTVGQSDARNHPDPMVGGEYKLAGGFWVIPECPSIPADYDGDCDVDQADYLLWETCASGPDVPYAGNCSDTDFDNDLDTDQEDLGVFQRCYSGENNPADPSCAD